MTLREYVVLKTKKDFIKYNKEQLEVILRARDKQVDLGKFVTPKYTPLQMEQILCAICDGVDFKRLLNYRIPSREMLRLRLKMTERIDILI